MIRANKKGFIFVPALVFFSVLILTSAFFTLTIKYGVHDANGLERTLGKKQAELFKTYQSGENTRLYIELSAGFAAKDTIFELAETKSGCGTYFGYSVWSDSENKCFPKKEAIEAKFKTMFNNKLNAFVEKYEGVVIPKDNYEFTLSQNDKLKIIALANKPLAIGFGFVFPRSLTVQLPSSLVWPAAGDITSCYGFRELRLPGTERKQDWHDGIDLGLKVGTDVGSVADGEVVQVCTEWVGVCACSIGAKPGSKFACANRNICAGKCGNYGNYVIIKHNEAFYTKYSHLLQVLVEDGDNVKQGQAIAKSGNTGLSGGPHLDLKVYFSRDFRSDIGKGSHERNPLCYLPPLPESKFIANSCKDNDGTGAQFCDVSKDLSLSSVSPSENIYSIKPNFRLQFDYSFEDYTILNITARKIAEEANKNCFKSGADFDSCINKVLSTKKDFKWSFECEKEEGEEGLIKKQLRLCAESKYSFLIEAGKIKPVIYKIAVFAGDTLAPMVVQNIKITDTKIAEENITVSFDANEEEDIAHYEIYYSESEFVSVDDEGVVKLGTINHTDKATYSTTFKIPEDGKVYYFAVIAVDTSGNPSGFKETEQGVSVDDLNPGPVEKIEFTKAAGINRIDITVTPPTVNEDGTELKDLTTYTLFLEDIISGSCSEEDIPGVLTEFFDEAYTFDMTGTTHKTQIRLPDGIKRYCLVAIANDEVLDATAIRATQYSENSIISIDISS